MSAADGFCSHVFHPSNAPCSKCGRYFTEESLPVAATVPHAPFGPGGPAGHCAKVVAAEPAAPCPHSRSDWRHCPHCLGINQPQTPVESVTTSTGGPVTIAPQPQKPKAITRYSHNKWMMGQRTNGDYVLYTDHIAALASMPSPPDVGREELEAIITDALGGPSEHGAQWTSRCVTSAIPAKFHVAKKVTP